jgi:prepilin-type N-terminal cleavage/methylation domain-containing protein
MKILRREHGFTLIELMIVIGIIAVIMGLGITNYISFAERNRVRTGAEETQTFLSDIQNRARMGHRGTEACSPTSPTAALSLPLRSWRVVLSGRTMTARATCGPINAAEPSGLVGTTLSSEVVVVLPQNVTFTDPVTIILPALYNSPRTTTGASADQQIRVWDGDVQNRYCFHFTSGGAITIGDWCP